MDTNKFISFACENNIIRELKGISGFPLPDETRTRHEIFRDTILESAKKLVELKYPHLTPRQVVDLYRASYMVVPPFELDFLD
jgi:hypothetical protein